MLAEASSQGFDEQRTRSLHALQSRRSSLPSERGLEGVDPDHPSIATLAPYDQFHGRGLEATLEIAGLMQAKPADHILDIGSGLGGPARYFANRFGCRVTGIDLTPEFCDVARHLTRLLDMEERVKVEVADALRMPFADSSFDGAYSMNVSMNIADKGAFYREVHRVLRPGGWLVLWELAKGEGGDLDYPTPWASSGRTSFLSTPEETRRGLLAAGFDVIRLHSSVEETRAFGARSRAMVERGEKPPHRAVMLIHELFPSKFLPESRHSRIPAIQGADAPVATDSTRQGRSCP